MNESNSHTFGCVMAEPTSDTPYSQQRVLHHRSRSDEHRELQAAKLRHRGIVKIRTRLQMPPPAKRALLDHSPIRKVGSLVSWQNAAC